MLLDVFPLSVIENEGKFIQQVPNKIALENELFGNLIELSPENFVIFNLPDFISASYFQMMNSLSELSRETSFPDFVLPSMTGEVPAIPFDLENFTLTKNMAVVKACKQIGWRGRSMLAPEFITEYYDLHLFFLFEEFKVKFRDSIFISLNKAIARAGSKLGFEAKITIAGLPTLTDIQASQKLLADGNSNFNELINPYLAYS